MLIVKFRERPGMARPAHEVVQVFVGKADGALALAGELVMRHEEWATLRDRLRFEQAVGEQREVRFVTTRGGHVEVDAAGVVPPPTVYGPKADGHPSVGEPCPACQQPFAEGDLTTLVTLGPGADPEARQRAAAGRPYSAVAVEVHFACAAPDLA